jgi:Fe-Mn family superoxide dismutase
MAFELPDLPYDYEALQPYMSKETLEYHHDKHHKAYVDNGNKLAAEAGMGDLSVEEVVRQSFGKNQGLFNNAAQHYNHIHFWKWMKKDGGGNKLPAALQKAIDSDLGGYDKFRADFINAGTTQFGSGWAWVSVKDGKLEITKTPNGENPLVHGASPILGVDVWDTSKPSWTASSTGTMSSNCTRRPAPDPSSAKPRPVRGFAFQASRSSHASVRRNLPRFGAA